MTKAEVEAGVCGFRTTIRATTRGDGRVELAFESDCAQVRQYADEIEAVDPVEELYRRDGDGRLSDCGPCHATCLVPVAALKVIEAEAGLALPRDAGIRFVETDE